MIPVVVREEHRESMRAWTDGMFDGPQTGPAIDHQVIVFAKRHVEAAGVSAIVRILRSTDGHGAARPAHDQLQVLVHGR